ncbi:MAG: thioesterase [Caulobacter sp.]|nr:thioesterase [Caulobacter sp.]
MRRLPGLSVDLPGVEIWRGGVNTWECDENAHMNVRFFVARAMEGLITLAAELGLPHAFTAHAGATLLVREHHIRFMREAQENAPLHMLGGVVSISESEAWLLQLLVHSNSGEIAASFQTRVAHATPREGRVFPWSRRTLELAETLKVEVPETARARSVSLEPFEPTAGLERAHTLGLTRIGLGGVTPAECDTFGRARPELFIGRVSDGIAGLIRPFRRAIIEHAETKPARIGGAVLEYRIAYLDWPRAGDRFELRSGLIDATHRTMRMAHWMLDPESGKAVATSEAVAVTMDLDARKVVPITEAAQAALRQHATAGLGL